MANRKEIGVKAEMVATTGYGVEAETLKAYLFYDERDPSLKFWVPKAQCFEDVDGSLKVRKSTWDSKLAVSRPNRAGN